ncbi:MAG: hypothetical protein ACFFD9_07915 [Candidatus Thorarchaeota archaeon]
MTPPSHRYIAVDRSSVMRCQWCGTAESRYWVKGEGGPWCSDECRFAGTLERSIIGVLLCVFSFLLVFSPVFVSFPLDIATLTFLIPMVICCPALLYGSNIELGLKTRRRTPRGSRRSSKTLETDAFFCQNCGGSLEVRVGKTTSKCAYCGVTNEIAIR